MTVKIARQVGPDAIDIAYESFGDPQHPPLILLMGVGGQMINWPDGLIESLVQRNLFVVRMDNRDVGLSTHLHDAPVPDLPAALGGDFSSVSYTLSNMAGDVTGLMDALGLESVHLVGASMGGFIAQTLTIENPQRVRSLTSMMSTTGASDVGQADPAIMSIFQLPQPTNREQAMDNAVAAFKVVGSPGFPMDETAVRTRAGLAFDRSYDPMGTARQAVASVASGDRTGKLRTLKVPTLVIHGDADRMCNVSGGRATADAIAGSRLVVIEGMGHDIPRAVWGQLTDLIADHIAAAETGMD